MVVITGIERLNQKGYVLLESLTAFLIITLCISVYLPVVTDLLVTIKEEKKTMDMVRIGYEQSQKIALGQEVDTSWQTGGNVYEIIVESSQKKKICIRDNQHQRTVELLSSKINLP